MNLTWLYVAAVYAAAIALARRGGVFIPFRVAFLFYVLALGYLWEPMTRDAVNVHADVLKKLQPWDFLIEDETTANPGMNDVPLQEVPWANAVRESWKSLTPPLWNPYTGCGAVLLANGQSAALSPLRLLALPLNLAHSMTAEAAMKILVALTFLFLYCRRHWSEPASIVAAVSFGFCGFLFSWLHFPHSTAGCWLPAVLYFIDLLVERVTFARFVGGALVWVAILFAGHPETAAHVFLAALFYALWMRPRFKTLVALGGVMVVAVLLAAPYLAPFAEAVTKGSRYHEVRNDPAPKRPPLPYSDLRSAVPIVQPLYFGPIREAWGPSDAEGMSAFAGVLAVASWLAVVWYVIATRRWRSRETGFALLTLLMLGVLFEWPGFSGTVHFLIPLGAHARLRLVLACAMAIQAAAAIDFARTRRAPLLVAIGVVAAMIAVLLFQFPDVVRDRKPAVLRAAIPAAAVLLTAALFAITRARVAMAALAVAVVADLWLPGRAFNPPTPDSLLYARTPVIAKLQELTRANGAPSRIAGQGAMLFQNAASIFGLEDIRVHDPMANNRYIHFLGAVSSKYDPMAYFQFWDDLDNHVLDYLNVRYLVTDPGLTIGDPGRWRSVYEGPDGKIFENRDVLPRFYAPRNVVIDFSEQGFAKKLSEMNEKWSHTVLLDRLKLENQQMHDDFFNTRPLNAPAATVTIAESGATSYRIKTNAPRYTLVASSIPWWPGWKVERNGKRIDPIRVNSAFLGFAVTPGRNDVRVWYAPDTWRYGWVVAGLTSLALVGFRGFGVPRLQGGSKPRNPATP